jgi:hypothetical protein
MGYLTLRPWNAPEKLWWNRSTYWKVQGDIEIPKGVLYFSFFFVFSKALFWTKLVIFWKPGRELGWRRLASAFASHQC